MLKSLWNSSVLGYLHVKSSHDLMKLDNLFNADLSLWALFYFQHKGPLIIHSCGFSVSLLSFQTRTGCGRCVLIFSRILNKISFWRIFFLSTLATRSDIKGMLSKLQPDEIWRHPQITLSIAGKKSYLKSWNWMWLVKFQSKCKFCSFDIFRYEILFTPEVCKQSLVNIFLMVGK